MANKPALTQEAWFRIYVAHGGDVCFELVESKDDGTTSLHCDVVSNHKALAQAVWQVVCMTRLGIEVRCRPDDCNPFIWAQVKRQ